MKLTQALEYATKIAALLTEKSKQFGQMSIATINGQSLMGTLSIMMAADSKKVEALHPWFQEIILFGSAAEGKENPSDVDLIAFDQGFYSNVILAPLKRARYGYIQRNLRDLLTGWFGFQDGDPEVKATFDNDVDLLVLPLAVLTDPVERQEFADQQSDPEFLQNAFSNMLCFDPDSGQFVKIDLSYFEQKYSVDLSELRKTADVTA